MYPATIVPYYLENLGQGSLLWDLSNACQKLTLLVPDLLKCSFLISARSFEPCEPRYHGQTEKSANANEREGKWCWNQSETGRWRRKKCNKCGGLMGITLAGSWKSRPWNCAFVSFKILLIDRGNFKAWQRFCAIRIRKHSRVLSQEKNAPANNWAQFIKQPAATHISVSRLASVCARPDIPPRPSSCEN